ncbi:MAG: FMN-binding glutamate synthase family protein [Firmicutes bacterium]|nr:FMN-binding glutamate synthase family protein [Bacillota bacterium]
MSNFLLNLSGTVLGITLGAGFLAVMTLVYLPALLPKREHLIEWLTIIRKITWRGYCEANLRAETGKALNRPYGAKRGILSFDKFQFNPVYLTKTPINNDREIDTSVVLGPGAQKPLALKIPILIGGMAYGSGYSLAAKIALAKAAAMVGTAANSGNGPFLEEERHYAAKYILQYTRGFWSKSETFLKQADMIEIALGHSARGSAPVRISGKKITPEAAARYGAIPGLDLLMDARLPEVETPEQWKGLIQYLKEVTGGVPIGVKFGASNYLEEEMRIFIEGGADVLIFDGTEGGTHGGASILMDDSGVPILPALCRAARYLRERGLKGRVSLVVGGGLVTPGDFSKCLALGADAIIVGTITAVAQANVQIDKVVPWEPPTGLLNNDGKAKHQYDPDLGAQHLHNFFQSCIAEMILLARTLGKSSLRELNPSDMVALDPLYAKIAGVDYVSSS